MRLHSTLARIICLLLIAAFIVGCNRIDTTPGPQTAPQLQTALPTLSLPPQIRIPEPTFTAQPSAAPKATPLPALDGPIIWYLRGTAPADLSRVNERLNRELALRGFGAKVEMRVLAPGDFEQHIAEAIKAGEKYDFTSIPANTYMEMVEKQALLPLNGYHNPTTQQSEDLLTINAPGLRDNIPAPVWQAWMAGGRRRYAIPNQAAWVLQTGVAIRADVVKALNLQADLDSASKYADLTPLFAKIQAAVNSGDLESRGVANARKVDAVFGMADLTRPEIAGYDPIGMPFAVRYDDSNRSVVNWFATEDFKTLAELRRAWQVAGFGPAETLTPEELVEGYQEGRFVVEVGGTVGQDSLERYGYHWVEKALSPAFIPSGAVAASLTGISASIGDQPERVHRVMLLLEWLHTDVKLYNLLAVGIEGDHWSWVDRSQGTIALVPGSRYRPDFADQVGDGSLTYTINANQASAGRSIHTLNANTPVSVVVGFVFNPRLVAGEVAAVKGVTPEWLDPLARGDIRSIPTYIQSMIKDLDTAGLKSIETELIEQMAAAKGAE